MRNATALKPIETSRPADQSGLGGLLEGYRFTVCEDAESFARALDIRREVYVGNFGYDVPVPDEYDHRSWLFLAEHVETGEAVGTMRIVPRAYGPVESEEYFRLPADLATANAIEISRFAILPEHRKTKTFLPVVSVGLFKLAYEFAIFVGADCEIVCSKPDRTWTYQSMDFRRTGITARYEKLNGAEHELMWHDFRLAKATLGANPFLEMCELRMDEVVLPAEIPALGLVEEPSYEPFRLAVGA